MMSVPKKTLIDCLRDRAYIIIASIILVTTIYSIIATWIDVKKMTAENKSQGAKTSRQLMAIHQELLIFKDHIVERFHTLHTVSEKHGVEIRNIKSEVSKLYFSIKKR